MLKSVKVRDYMAANLVTLGPDMEILRAIHALIENRISGAPVVDEHGNLVGVLSEQDCMRVALNAGYHEEYGGRVSEYMSRDVRTVDGDTSIEKAHMASGPVDGPPPSREQNHEQRPGVASPRAGAATASAHALCRNGARARTGGGELQWCRRGILARAPLRRRRDLVLRRAP